VRSRESMPVDLTGESYRSRRRSGDAGSSNVVRRALYSFNRCERRLFSWFLRTALTKRESSELPEVHLFRLTRLTGAVRPLPGQKK
jgi:hypothetical protein